MAVKPNPCATVAHRAWYVVHGCRDLRRPLAHVGRDTIRLGVLRMNVQQKQISSGNYSLRAGLPDRIIAAELEIENVLIQHGVKFAINVVKVDGRAVHQEIVLVDRKD